MGNEFYTQDKPYQYGLFKSEPANPGETRILRKPDIVGKDLIAMNRINRQTLLDSLEYHLERRPNDKFIGSREYLQNEKKYGKYIWKSYSEVYKLSQYFLYGVEKLNLCPEIEDDDENTEDIGIKKFMGFYSRNREEWAIADIGCQMNSIIIVTLYDTLGKKSLEYILNQTGLITIIIESRNLKTIIEMKENNNKLGKLKNLILLHCNEEKSNEVEEDIKKCQLLGLNIISYEEIINLGKNCEKNNDLEIINKEYNRPNPDSILTICYTSGTVNNPKGAMVTHNSVAVATNIAVTIGCNFLGPGDIILSFLPLAHIFEQLLFSVCIVFGTQTGFYSGSATRLVEDMQELKPTYFCGVPRIYERIYSKIMENINQRSIFIQRIFQIALKTKIYNYENYGILHHAIYDKLFFNKIKDLLGGKLKFLLTGGAPISPEMIKTLAVMTCVPITIGYGQTENAGSALLTSLKDVTCNTTGGLQNTAELKLVDVPEFGYYSTDKNPITGIPEPRGEICFRGYTVFKGYYKNPEETQKTIDKDGWFHSGDIGTILTGQGNALRIIDRVKCLFKLSQGEYVSPERIENVLKESKYVSQIFIHGECLYSFVIAIVYPNKEKCTEYIKNSDPNNKGKEFNNIDINELCHNQLLIDEIIKDCSLLGKKNDLKGFEIPKKIILANEPFTVENNLMTPTLKLKPKEIELKYKNDIKKLYEYES